MKIFIRSNYKAVSFSFIGFFVFPQSVRGNWAYLFIYVCQTIFLQVRKPITEEEAVFSGDTEINCTSYQGFWNLPPFHKCSPGKEKWVPQGN